MIISAFGFLIGWFQQNQTYIFNWFVLQECGILLGELSDCEELVWVFQRRWWVWCWKWGEMLQSSIASN